jgi:LEA14-like dessication related protein
MKLENNSNILLTAVSFLGDLEIEQNGRSHRLGSVTVNDSYSIPSKGTAALPIKLRLSYSDVKNAWDPLTTATTSKTVWNLNGNMRVKVNNVTLPAPVNLSKTTGADR